jgi:hypothetical protein
MVRAPRAHASANGYRPTGAIMLVRAIWRGELIAESDDTVIVEGKAQGVEIVEG